MGSERSEELTESDVYALLAHRRRRITLRILEDFPTPVSACQLTELVAGCEYEDPSTETRRSVYLSLAHNHLPRLADADVVAYDSETGSVSPDRNFGVLHGVIAKWSDESDSFVGE